MSETDVKAKPQNTFAYDCFLVGVGGGGVLQWRMQGSAEGGGGSKDNLHFHETLVGEGS